MLAKWLRLGKILRVCLKHGLDQLMLQHENSARIRWLLRFAAICLSWRRDLTSPSAIRLRKTLEELGPIFVKFGQILSTRRDLLPADIADELARLQDSVPPFSGELAMELIQNSFHCPPEDIFDEFDPIAIASASVAQVHFARLYDKREVAVKILRPGISHTITQDISLLDSLAWLLEKLWTDGKRLRPREVVKEFAKHLEDELDLMREAANCSQLGRNFANSKSICVPEVYWDYCRQEVMVMQRMQGIPISQISKLRDAGIDLHRLARSGVEIFFTQVFRDAFFHADMHPGNILIADQGENFGSYVALDFGIMGSLSEVDQRYLAINFLAFFQRDYHRVAKTHIESGWAPANTRIDDFEAAIRAVCEPIFNRPLSQISFGHVLLRLFQTSRRFNVEIQPQLVLLQKTLLNIEGLGRQLDPDLDLWQTAKPFLESWMSEQVGWRAFWKQNLLELPQLARNLPQLPRLLYQQLQYSPVEQLNKQVVSLSQRHKTRNYWLVVIALLLALLVSIELFNLFINIGIQSVE